MKKNMNENFEITVDEMTEIFGDTPVEMSFREVKEGMDSFFGLMRLTVELVNLIRKEDEMKKHHRAYLHVREEIAECANEDGIPMVTASSPKALPISSASSSSQLFATAAAVGKQVAGTLP